MTAFPKYPAYKDSGVEWLGEVPEHWGVYPNRRLFEERKVPVGKRAHEYKLLSLTLNGVIPRDMENPKGKFPAEFNTYSEVEPDDLVFCLFDLDETPRTVGISPCAGMITGAYTIFKPKREVNPKYQFYYYLSLDEQKALKPLYTGLRKTISRSTFASAKSPCPPRAEQDRIVAFLDEKTAQIDALIAKKQRQIELLDEQKAILINRAVTRGLHPNPDLQDSGIPWIGPIPKGWEVKRIGHLGKVGNGSTPSRSNPRYWDRADFPWLNSGSVNQGVITSSDQSVSRLALRECHLPLLKAKSIVIAITGQGKTRGTAAMLMTPATINQHLAYVEIQSPSAMPEFVLLALSAQYQQLRAISESGSTKGALTCQDVKEFKIALPPLDQQKALIEAAEALKAQIATAQSKLESQIQTLQTLRSTLIAHAVTGKIRV
jgi:type I restriction enzyme S subunit